MLWVFEGVVYKSSQNIEILTKTSLRALALQPRRGRPDLHWEPDDGEGEPQHTAFRFTQVRTDAATLIAA